MLTRLFDVVQVIAGRPRAIAAADFVDRHFNRTTTGFGWLVDSAVLWLEYNTAYECCIECSHYIIGVGELAYSDDEIPFPYHSACLARRLEEDGWIWEILRPAIKVYDAAQLRAMASGREVSVDAEPWALPGYGISR